MTIQEARTNGAGIEAQDPGGRHACGSAEQGAAGHRDGTGQDDYAGDGTLLKKVWLKPPRNACKSPTLPPDMRVSWSMYAGQR